MKRIIAALFISVLFMISLSAQIEWRNDRTGIYKNEQGLLKKWSEGGPELLWHFDGLGLGYTSVSIDNEKIFVTGYIEGDGYLFVFDMNGKLLNKIRYGREFDDSYPGTRSTVIPDDGKLYIVSGTAELYCYDQNSLELLWTKSYTKDYEGENTKHGYHEPPLIVGDKLIVTPGGEKYNIVALNKTTGDMIWSSEGAGDPAGYCAPIYIGYRQTPQIVTMMADNIIGVDIANGNLLWSHRHTNRFREHPNTPIYFDDMIFCSSSYGKGSEMLRLVDGGRGIEKVWEAKELDVRTGHMIKVGDYIYGASDKAGWYCVDWNTGKIVWHDKSLSPGCIISADNMLYCYSEKGEIALAKPCPEKFDIISQFVVTKGTEQHWAHPVIYEGIMYVRHGDALLAYKVK